jgi:hypothetical protein
MACSLVVAGALSPAGLVYADNTNSPEELAEVVPEGDSGNAELPDAEIGETDSNRQLRIAIEMAHAFGSEESNRLKGFAPSLYQGKWYMPNREDRRKCISKREAHHNYTAVSAGGIYRGAYQFSGPLARGASWMMQAEVKKEMGDAGVDLVQQLRKTPMNQWNRYWQDRAFWTIWAKGRGSKHWHGGSKSC